MSLEIECKYCDVDFIPLRGRLAGQGATCKGVCFEQNTLFDTKPPSFFDRRMLLRLRSVFMAGTEEQTYITLKRPSDGKQAEAAAGLKVLDELEVSVSDRVVFAELLRGLGYEPFAAYEKVREDWLLPGVAVSLDVLPFGSFVELEGEQDRIEAAVVQLALGGFRRSTASYHALHREYTKTGSSEIFDPSFTFSEEDRKTWCATLGISTVPAVALSSRAG